MSKWLQCRLFPMYEVSKQGQIRRIKTKRIMKLFYVGTTAYKRIVVQLRNEGKSYTEVVARLVADAFLGCVDGMDVHHIDGDTRNNKPHNLKVLEHGVHSSITTSGHNHSKGELNPKAKLNGNDVVSICRLLDTKNLDYKTIGAKFGVTRKTIANIDKGNTWQHITGRK